VKFLENRSIANVKKTSTEQINLTTLGTTSDKRMKTSQFSRLGELRLGINQTEDRE